MTDAKAFIALAGPAGNQVAKDREDRHSGILHGRPDRVSHRVAAVPDPRRSSRLVPWRRVGDRRAPNSPHLQAAKSKAQFLIAIAENDDARSPNDKTTMKETFAKANLPAEIEVYAGAAHGWCPPDSKVYNEPQAEKAWSRLLVLYGKALA